MARASSLPDGRAYELVTPPDLGGPATPILNTAAGIPIGQPYNLVSPDGDSVIWMTLTPPPGVDATGFDNVFRSRRDATSGWISTYVSPPGSKLRGSNPYLVWATPDLQRLLWLTDNAVIDPTDLDPLDPTVPRTNQQYRDFYRREADGAFTRITQGSMAPPVPGEQPFIIGTSIDGLKVIFGDSRQLEPDADTDTTLYQRAGNKTTVVSKDELGNLVPGAGANGHGVSDDGNIVVFGDLFDEKYYMRDIAAERTTLVASAPSGQGLHFESLSASGKRVFFTTAAALTSDDIDTSSDLYEYDAVSGSLNRISAPTGAPALPGPGNADACAAPAYSCDVSPVAVSRDGAKVYFLSPEQLAGTEGADGGANLYLSEDGNVRFVATLDPGDPVFGVPSGTVNAGNPYARHVRFTPDGTKLLFESRARLTGYDNAGHMEIYLHDPAANTLICVSCRPSGAPPTGDATLREAPGAEFQKDPLYPANSDEHGSHIFFQSMDALLPQDTNGRYDVYEYTVSNASTALISSGVSPNDSAYLGNGVDGKDVFFFTTDALVPQDQTGSLYKLYDARVDGGFPASPPPSKCTGEGCRGAQTPAPGVIDPGTAQIRRTRPPTVVPTSKLTVSGTKSVTGTSLRLAAKVSGAGRLRATGSGVTAASVKTSHAATYHVTVKLSKASVARLKRAHRLVVPVTVRFTPSEGTARSVRVRLTFKVASKKKGH